MHHHSIAAIDIVAFREREAQGLITARTHPSEDLIIWNYTPQCQYAGAWDEVTLQARGLITKSDGTIIARPFRKFFNYEQHQGDLPLEPFKVTEKLDGSLGILFFINDTPQIATRGSFTSDQALRATKILHERYKDFFPHLLATSHYTYLFEIVYPANRVVVDYGDMEDLILLTMIRTDTGEEYDIHDPAVINLWPFPITKYYDGIADIAELRKREEANREGFVIRFESGLRLKAKFSEYKKLHAILTRTSSTTIWESLANGQDIASLFDHVPDEFAGWVRKVVSDLTTAKESWINEAVAEFNAMPQSTDRKTFALAAIKSPMKAALFHLFDRKSIEAMAWRAVKPEFSRPFHVDDDHVGEETY